MAQTKKNLYIYLTSKFEEKRGKNLFSLSGDQVNCLNKALVCSLSTIIKKGTCNTYYHFSAARILQHD